MWNAGYALGASLENTLVVSDNRILNPEGLRFPDEFVRHKVLDAIGDLALAGAPLLGAYRSVRGGHKLNHAVLCALMADPSAWTWVEAEAAAAGARPCRGRRPAWRRPSGPTFPEPALVLPSGRPCRSATFRAECRPISFGPDGDLSGRRRRDQGTLRPVGPCVRGTGVIRSMASRSVTINGPCGRRARCWRAWRRSSLVAAALGACSLFDKDTVIPDEPADKLYNEGLYLLNSKKDPKSAAKKFEEVDRQHPYSEWARKSLIMSAYAYYEAGDYDDCISAAQRYVDAASRQSGCGLRAISDRRRPISTRSRKSRATRTAPRRRCRALEEVIRKYPNSEYAVAAKRKIEIARDQLAGKEMDVGRYYMNKRDYTGAINRFKIVVTRYQTTRHVEEALLRLTEAYMALGIVGRGADLRRRARAQLPGQPLVQGRLRPGAVEGPAADREQGLLDQPVVQGVQEARARIASLALVAAVGVCTRRSRADRAGLPLPAIRICGSACCRTRL